MVAHAQFSSHSHFFFKKCTVLEPQPLFLQKMGPWPQDGTKSGPRSPQVGLETVLTCDRFLHRFSDRFLVVFGLRFGALLGPPGLHLGGQNGTKTDPKTIKNRSEKSRDQKSYPRRSWTRLGAILGRFGAPSWAKKRLKPFILKGLVKNHFFEDKTVRRRFRDQLGPKKAPT